MSGKYSYTVVYRVNGYAEVTVYSDCELTEEEAKEQARELEVELTEWEVLEACDFWKN